MMHETPIDVYRVAEHAKRSNQSIFLYVKLLTYLCSDV